MPTRELDGTQIYVDGEHTCTGPRMTPPVLMGKDRACAECGKTFRAGREWAYKLWPRAKDRTICKIFCSYGCMSRYRERQPLYRRRQARIKKELEGGDAHARRCDP